MAERVLNRRYSGHTKPGPAIEGLEPREDSARRGCRQAERAPARAADWTPDRRWKARSAPSRSPCAAEGKVRLYCQASRRKVSASQATNGWLSERAGPA